MAGLAQAVMWHRQAAALALAADRVGVGVGELPAIQARIVAQRAELTAAGAAPDLTPSPAEIAAAMPALGDLSEPAVVAALRAVSSTLDAAEAALRVSPPPVAVPPAPAPPAPLAASASAPTPVAPVAPAPATTSLAGLRPGLRNALVYGGYSVTVLLVQLFLLATADEERQLPLLAPVCLGVLPAFAWAAGWLTIGAAFRPPPGGAPLARTPRLGALVCLMPNLALCAGLGLLYLVR